MRHADPGRAVNEDRSTDDWLLPENEPPILVSRTRRKALYFILGGLLLAVGTPALTALTQPQVRFYLLQPVIYMWQPIPYCLAAALSLSWRSVRASRVGLVLARLLFFGAALFYLPVLTGLLPTGGDMIALGYVMFAIVTIGAVLVVTLVGFGVSWIRHRQAVASGRKN
jgi:hypothetical protein